MKGAQLARVRGFLTLPAASRRDVLRRKRDHALSTVFLGWCGNRLNRANRFAYLSYVPDSIREYRYLPEFNLIVASWTHGNERRNAGDLPRLLFLVQNAEQLLREGVPGDFAELGVHQGHSAQLLADTLARVSPNRRLHLFDTFEGFDERDLGGVDSTVAPIYDDTSLRAVQRRVRHDDSCTYYQGYFPDTARAVDPFALFAFVHLDCDLFEPTRAGLNFFYSRMTHGGIIVVHDYSSGHWPGVAKAVNEFLVDKPERLILVPDKSGTAVLRRVTEPIPV